MSNYTQTTDFSAKDSLPTGDPNKIIKGSDFDTEFAAISTAVATKADSSTLTSGYQPLDADLTAIAGLTSAANKVPMFSGSGTATVIDFLDEDNMASNSATAVPSQQSVKAYADIAASTTVAGKVELATAAETQAVTDPARAVTPLSLASLVPKAWVVFDGTTNTAGNCDISGSFNVSSVTDNGTGDYTINFASALPDANYAVIITTSGSANSAYSGFVETGATATKTTSAVRIRSTFANATTQSYIDSTHISVLIFGA